jgi:D-glycero-D-manno-heptose 1,7-bisphosphate phosphatase
MKNDKRRAIFFDRDGTLAEEVGYINHISRFKLYPFAPQIVKMVNESKFLAILVTNQAGLARGYFPEELLEQVHNKMKETLQQQGAFLDDIYFCPHHEFASIEKYKLKCNCRKPEPGMLLKAAKDHYIDLARSYVVGDKYTDIELAYNVGAKSVMVMTGYGIGEYTYQQHEWKVFPDHIVENALDAVKLILTSDDYD